MTLRTARGSEVSAAHFDFDEAVLGHGLAPQAESLIARAGALGLYDGGTEALLLEARRLAPDHPAALIALYRHYFYAHRLERARAVAEEALRVSAARCAGPGCDVRGDTGARFYLFALKGYAYLSLRLGDLEGGRASLRRLRELDPEDIVGGAVLARALARCGAGGDDEERADAGSTRGWPAEGAHVD